MPPHSPDTHSDSLVQQEPHATPLIQPARQKLFETSCSPSNTWLTTNARYGADSLVSDGKACRRAALRPAIVLPLSWGRIGLPRSQPEKAHPCGRTSSRRAGRSASRHRQSSPLMPSGHCWGGLVITASARLKSASERTYEPSRAPRTSRSGSVFAQLRARLEEISVRSSTEGWLCCGKSRTVDPRTRVFRLYAGNLLWRQASFKERRSYGLLGSYRSCQDPPRST